MEANTKSATLYYTIHIRIKPTAVLNLFVKVSTVNAIVGRDVQYRNFVSKRI